MRNKILVYLLIFSVLFVIFIYVNDKRILDARDATIEQLENRSESQEAEIEELRSETQDQTYFSLESNEDALTYFENRGLDPLAIKNKVRDEIISRNRANEDNDLVPFEGMEGPMRINKIKLLNHKWIIADFTDGTYWGEILLSYSVDDQGEISFTPEKSFLYQKD
ncbi:hypothetical protein [Salegentibacter chungangensis]|uniref:Hydrolase n=1 Tax=Salegentibacter chungangensis TaxID=1335724 RepID=A0ABW3NU04_9FLAO